MYFAKRHLPDILNVMKTTKNISLKPLTSFNAGGLAERLIEIESGDNITEILKDFRQDTFWVLGYGTNVLISDAGLFGTTLLLRNKQIKIDGTTITVDAGAWLDDVISESINHGLWGMELMSGIPGSVGAGIFISVNAYGQGISDNIIWVEAWNPNTRTIQRIDSSSLKWGYKQSIFQAPPYNKMIITRARFVLSKKQTTPLTYQSAVDVADELGLDINSLADRRKIILETRARAQSIFVHGQGHPKTAGSFFRNPLVTPRQAEHIIKFDETGRSEKQITAMNKVHGGDTLRVSASHVLLAAGFQRDQTWGDVRLHPSHILKIENTGEASAQDIYDVSQEIIRTVKKKLSVELTPEARILGDFK